MKSFLIEALRSINTSGTIKPSSKYLIKKCLNDLNVTSSNLILEFGTGNGCITEAILAKMNHSSTLISFETNPTFFNYCREKFKNEHRLILLEQSAFDFEDVLKDIALKPEIIISSLPLSLFDKKQVSQFIESIQNSLAKNGKFVQYQYSRGIYSMLKGNFSKVKTQFTLLNLPPALIYQCES